MTSFVLLPLITLDSPPALNLAQFATPGLSFPTMVVQDPVNPSVQFVCGLDGRVRVLQDQAELNDSFIEFASGTQILAMTFDPDPRYFYVYKSDGSGGNYSMKISRYRRDESSDLVAEANSETLILKLPYASASVHRGGALRFGPDGMLYIGTGDNKGAGEYFVNNPAQNPFELYGKFLRINPHVDGFPADPNKNYSIPPDNPFLDGNPIAAAPEIWSFGWRNPFRFHFDPLDKLGTGAMVVGETGNHTQEEIDYEPIGHGARNYGWDRYEGDYLLNDIVPLAYGPHTMPIHVVPWINGYAMIGGGVYRGLQLGEEFFGRGFYADYLSGNVSSIKLNVQANGEATASDEQANEFNRALSGLVCIEPDSEGEMLIVRMNPAELFRVVRENYTWLTGIQPMQGRVEQGQVRSLIAEDGKLLSVGFASAATNQKTREMRLEINAKTNKDSWSQVEIETLARLSLPATTQLRVEIYDWDSQEYEELTSVTLSKSLTKYSFGASLTPGNVSQSKTVRFRLSAKFDRPVPFGQNSPSLSVQIDKFKLTLH
ncbi:MAG: PQQ-dependent sugar dehydrogenase [Fimbriimonadales bacterium]